MKQKIEILIEEEVADLANLRAAEENRPVSDLIEDAIVAYLGRKMLDRKRGEEAYKIFCGQPMRISKDQFEELLKEDPCGE
jgi:hypothetical protein